MITKTKCGKCIFKITSDSKQSGCELDIDKILVNNYPGLYGDHTIDKSNDSWVLNNFRCSYARTTEWLNILKETTTDHPIDRVIKDSVIPYYMVVLINSDQDDIEDILQDISINSIYWPEFISFILTPKSSYKPKEAINIIEKYSLPKWKLHYITDIESTVSEMIDLCLDTNLGNTRSSFIFIKYADTIYKSDTIRRINDIVNHCIGKKVAIITDNFLDGLVLDKSLYISMNKQIGLVYDYIMNDSETFKIKML